jgi:hypothetical protein
MPLAGIADQNQQTNSSANSFPSFEDVADPSAEKRDVPEIS